MSQVRLFADCAATFRMWEDVASRFTVNIGLGYICNSRHLVSG